MRSADLEEKPVCAFELAVGGELGCPRTDVGSFVNLICARTLDRVGVCPDWQTEAIASSTTCVAAYTGGPNVPNFGKAALAWVTRLASAAIAVMSGANDETYEPGDRDALESSPSVPRSQPADARGPIVPKLLAVARGISQGRMTTSIGGVTLRTSLASWFACR